MAGGGALPGRRSRASPKKGDSLTLETPLGSRLKFYLGYHLPEDRRARSPNRRPGSVGGHYLQAARTPARACLEDRRETGCTRQRPSPTWSATCHRPCRLPGLALKPSSSPTTTMSFAKSSIRSSPDGAPPPGAPCACHPPPRSRLLYDNGLQLISYHLTRSPSCIVRCATAMPHAPPTRAIRRVARPSRCVPGRLSLCDSCARSARPRFPAIASCPGASCTPCGTGVTRRRPTTPGSR